MKKKTLALLLVLLLALGLLGVLAACGRGGADGIPSEIVEIKSSKQTSGSLEVEYTNYVVVLADAVDWEKLSDKDKQRIIDYSFNEVYSRNKANDVRYFNVLAYKESAPDKLCFMYNRSNEEVTIYHDGVPTGTPKSPPAPPAPAVIE